MVSCDLLHLLLLLLLLILLLALPVVGLFPCILTRQLLNRSLASEEDQVQEHEQDQDIRETRVSSMVATVGRESVPALVLRSSSPLEPAKFL